MDAGIAVLSSVLPYSLELIALRRLAAHVFGILLSLEPAVAAVAGSSCSVSTLRPRSCSVWRVWSPRAGWCWA